LVRGRRKMASEWDVLAEIRLAMQQLGDSQPTLSHIKGHQDSKRPIEELPLKAQLNCKADKLADQYLKDFPDIDRLKVPLLPTAGCQLHLAKGTITHNLKLDLTHARSVPTLKSKLCHKHAWLEHEFYDIDWTSHGLALKRLAKHRKTITQYLHDWLPVGKRVHMYDTRYTSWCHSCRTDDNEVVEDTVHLRQCSATSRLEWRTSAISNMSKLLKDIDTAVPLQELLLEAFSAMIQGKPDSSIKVDPAVADVAAAQAVIGWDQILKGRFSKLWQQTQARYLGSRATRHSNASTWMTRVIEAWIQEWLQLWTLRNHDRHGKDAATRIQAEEAQTIRELEMFYEAHAKNVTQRLRWIFNKPYEDRREMRIGIIRLWLNTWKPVIDASYKTDLTTG
jgi:hypothetical protein